MGGLGAWIDRLLESFSAQSEVRRGAILGIGFGLLLIVVVGLSCVILFTLIPALR